MRFGTEPLLNASKKGLQNKTRSRTKPGFLGWYFRNFLKARNGKASSQPLESTERRSGIQQTPRHLSAAGVHIAVPSIVDLGKAAHKKKKTGPRWKVRNPGFPSEAERLNP